MPEMCQDCQYHPANVPDKFKDSACQNTDDDCGCYMVAEKILDNWDYFQLSDGGHIVSAISKAKQAIRDCIEMGLSGEGSD